MFRHGRDHKLCVWELRGDDDASLDKTLPVDVAGSSASGKRERPALLHCLPVNALNFCAFSMMYIDVPGQASPEHPRQAKRKPRANVLFAVPNALDSGGIDIFHLPSERRITTISSDPENKTGMVMAVNLFQSASGDINVVSAYEDGHVMAFIHRGPVSPADFEIGNIASKPWEWRKLYMSRPHTQPVLSLDVSPMHDYFTTSAADALIVKHPIPHPDSPGYLPAATSVENSPLKTVNTKHSGQQGLRIRSDGKVFATAGWDSRVRVYSGKTMKELAVLKWHKEGCYTVSFGQVEPPPQSTPMSESPDTREENDEEQARGPTTQTFSLAAVQDQRNQKVRQTHWLAAGSKDGKISLWDIY